MPYSRNTLAGSNGVQTYTLGVDVIDATTLTVEVDNVAYVLGADWTLNAALTQITFTNPTFTGGEVIYIERNTPLADADRPVDFTAGAIIREEDLDNSVLHLLHIAQEGDDIVGQALQIGNDGVNWDAQTKRITNLDAPQAASDAARLQDVQDAAIAAGQLPDPGAIDPAFLSAQTGTWRVRTAAAQRTQLGLGTSAVLDTGTSDGDVVVVAAGGELPALKGTNLDLSGNVSIPSTTDIWLQPTTCFYLNTQNVKADPTGVAWPTSSAYTLTPVSSASTTNASSYIKVGTGSNGVAVGYIELQPAVYRITLSFTVLTILDTGVGQQPVCAGGIYKGDTGALVSARGFWRGNMPLNYPAAGEANTPHMSWSRTVLFTPGVATEICVKMADEDPSGVDGNLHLDSNWNAGCLTIECLG